MRSSSDSDFATPLRPGAKTVALEIDGRTVAVPEGTSVIRAAAEAGIHIPKLCATDSLEPSAHAGCVWSKSKDSAATRRRARLRRAPG